MTLTVRIADLQALTPHERLDAIARIAAEARAPANGQAVATLARIREYERRYEMTSAVLLDKLSRGLVRETTDIADWLLCLRIHRSIGGQEARPK